MENHSTWSGDATRNRSYDFGNSQGITINFGADDSSSVKELQEKKEQPIWMVESTIQAEPKDVSKHEFIWFPVMLKLKLFIVLFNHLYILTVISIINVYVLYKRDDSLFHCFVH